MPNPDLATYILAHRNPEVSLSNVADQLDRLLWILDESAGDAIEATRRQWLVSTDETAVELALLMDETFPADTRDELAAHCDRITRQFPKLAPLCKKILQQWDAQEA